MVLREPPYEAANVVWFGVSVEHAEGTLDNMVSELPERETKRATLISLFKLVDDSTPV